MTGIYDYPMCDKVGCVSRKDRDGFHSALVAGNPIALNLADRLLCGGALTVGDRIRLRNWATEEPTLEEGE